MFTAAPICGVPVESRTTPESLPAAAFACATDVFAPTEKHVSIRMRTPQVRRCSCFTWHYLPGAALAALFVSDGGFTVKSAVLETVLFERVSVATTSREYFPGAKVTSGSKRSMVTCSPVCFISSDVSLNCITCSLPFFTVYWKVALDLCVFSSGLRL